MFGLVYRTATYAPGNEHDLQVPWMYPFARAPWRTMDELRDIQALFRADAGRAARQRRPRRAVRLARVLGARLRPGHARALRSTCSAARSSERATIRVPGRPDVHDRGARRLAAEPLRALGAARRARRSSAPGSRTTRWRRGGTLALEMGSEPNTEFGSGADDVPPSVDRIAAVELRLPPGHRCAPPRNGRAAADSPEGAPAAGPRPAGGCASGFTRACARPGG